MNYYELREAIHWWGTERKLRGQEVNGNIRKILLFSFQTLDSLYDATRNFPLKWNDNNVVQPLEGGNRNMYFNIAVPSKDYLLLRASLALVSDLYSLLDVLVKEGDLLELEVPIKHLYDETNQFRDIRNFFTHLDERLTDLNKHGVSGESDTNCGICYTKNTTDCFHLILSEDKIYFSQYKKSLEKEVGRLAFDPIFEKAREIYEVLTSHKLQAKQYGPLSEVYPID